MPGLNSETAKVLFNFGGPEAKDKYKSVHRDVEYQC